VAIDLEQAVAVLSALAHESRLALFRILIQQGPEGLSAGVLADHLGIRPPVLSFHLAQLKRARLVVSRRRGRSIIYTPNFETMDELMAYMNENCCKGVAAACDANTPKIRDGGRPVSTR
jgi:DNA-binding transcriptional ArsR family regulator